LISYPCTISVAAYNLAAVFKVILADMTVQLDGNAQCVMLLIDAAGLSDKASLHYHDHYHYHVIVAIASVCGLESDNAK
jgi:hypothetical protein